MKKSVALTPIALMLCPSLVMSLQIITPPLKEQKSLVPSFSSIKQPCYHTTMRHRRKNSSTPATTAASSYTTLFSTPTNAIDAEIIKYKRTLLFPSNTKRRRNSGSPLHSSTSSNGNASSPSEEDTTTTSPSESTISFLKAVDNFGMNLKPLAIQAYEKSNAINGESKQQTNNKQTSLKSLFHRVKSNILWMMYIIYRGYRGFFVILPAVFREVYRQLEESDLVMDAYGDEEEVENGGGSSSGEVGEKKPLRLRTRITTSILSSILTMSYVVSGGIRVLGKFIQTFTNTTSVESSLEAAADEMADNEDKLAGRCKGK
mmetsp:Transcript_16898/g.25690  ORF Transcript_16898/g.25690 Transcript_16898/m.25690 type:complete len:317 (+) Transcript_16898:106-1056(+)